MFRFIAIRVLQTTLSMFVLISAVFFLSRLSGDPLTVLAPPQATTEQLDRLRETFGLDRSIFYQYWAYLQQVAHGNFGVSVYYSTDVTELISGRIWPSLQLAILALLIALAIALPFGVVAAYRRGGILDSFARIGAVLGSSIPSFFLGLLLIDLLATKAGLFPFGGRNSPDAVVLPALALGLAVSAPLMRLTRSSMIAALDSEYVKLARIKGVSEMKILWVHAFKNASLPVVTYAAVLWASLLGGAVAVEVVFSWPGLGRLMIAAVTNRDFPLIQGIVFVLGLGFILANLLADVAYAYLNPQIRGAR